MVDEVSLKDQISSQSSYLDAIVDDLKTIIIDGAINHKCDTLDRFIVIWHTNDGMSLGQGLSMRFKYRLFIDLALRACLDIIMINSDLLWIINSIFTLYFLFKCQAILPLIPISIDEYHYKNLISIMHRFISYDATDSLAIASPNHAMKCLIDLFESQSFVINLSMYDCVVPKDPLTDSEKIFKITFEDIMSNLYNKQSYLERLEFDNILKASLYYSTLKQSFGLNEHDIKSILDLYSHEGLAYIASLRYPKRKDDLSSKKSQ